MGQLSYVELLNYVFRLHKTQISTTVCLKSSALVVLSTLDFIKKQSFA